MSSPSPTETSIVPVKGEHIFPASYLEPLVLRWKELNRRGRHAQAMLVLEEIIVASTQMFKTVAQHETYHHTVDLDILVSAAQQKVVKWLLAWERKKGKLFTFFSKCAKNAFKSELKKVNDWRTKNYVTSDSLEKFFGHEDHAANKRDVAQEVRANLATLTCRWGDPQEIGAIHYLIECILEDDHERQAAIRGAAYAFCISLDLAKFFYSWVLSAMRDQLYKRIRVPYTEEDLVRLRLSYTQFVSLFDLPNSPFTWPVHGKYLVAVLGGSRLKIPTLGQIAQIMEAKQIFDEIEETDKDPDAVARVGRRHGKSARSAQDCYNEMVEALNPRRSGEYDVYGTEPE
jgi:hypothetical protein